jgi:FixJ family two-component response regulator
MNHIPLVIDNAASNNKANYPAGTTLFVVDDDDAVRKSLTRLLRASGWEVESFSSAAEFLTRERFSRIGCVLLDYQMPGMNGIELQAEMSKQHINLPVIFLTARGDIPTTVTAIKQGAVDFLIKPITESVLLSAIEQALHQHISTFSANHEREVILSNLEQLTAREHEVLKLVISGLLNKQIAHNLGIAEKTVKAHRGRVMEKMEASTIADLVHKYSLVETELQKHSTD